MSQSPGAYTKERRSKRVPVSLPATVKVGERAIHGICIDLSSGGAGLSVKTLPTVGEQVAIELRLPDGKLLAIRGEVMHAGAAAADRVGLRFGVLDAGSLIAIHSLVAEKKK